MVHLAQAGTGLAASEGTTGAAGCAEAAGTLFPGVAAGDGEAPPPHAGAGAAAAAGEETP